jgi:BirA family transcriptional regulator, biotin operon repressor / biotin---[acetyl-CoA-carboxylase] ligase
MLPEAPDCDRIVRETFAAACEYHDVISSTNDRAAHYAVTSAGPLPLVVVAGQQTAGRGRGGNRWWTGPGSLAFSVALEPEQNVPVGRPRSPLVSLAVGVAVAECLQALAATAAVGICWPNDVFAGRRKLAGILVEVLPRGERVIGIGVNTNNTAADAPEELVQRVTTLADLTGRTCDHTDVLTDLLLRLEKKFSLLGTSPEMIGRQANVLCLQHGEWLAVDGQREGFAGCCRGIAADGALLLDTPQGVRAIYSGTLAARSAS